MTPPEETRSRWIQPTLSVDELGESIRQPCIGREFEIVGIAAVLVVILDAAGDLEAEVFVKLQGVLVRRPGVTRHRPVVGSDRRDESFPDAASLAVGVDAEEEDVAVAS